ncbi:MAG: C40 family peptidase [Bacteroidales bacterium]
MTKLIGIIFLFLCPLFSMAQWSDTLHVSTRASALLPLDDSLQLVQCRRDSLKLEAMIRTAQIDSIINFSKKFIGTPYRYGGRTTKGFDCSGFMCFVFENFGMKLPPSSRSQALVGEQIAIDSVQKGDLVFFKGRNPKSPVIGHVAMVVEVSETNDIQFIHSTKHGLRLDWLSEEPYYMKRFMASRRIKLENTSN